MTDQTPKLGPVAAGIRDVARAAGYGDGLFELVDAALEALRVSLGFERTGYLEHSEDGVFRPPRWGRHPKSPVRIRLENHPALKASVDSARTAPLQVEPDSELSEALAGVFPGWEDGGPVVTAPVRRGTQLEGLLVLANRDGEEAGKFDRRTLDVASVYADLLGLGIAAVARASRLEHLREVLEERNQLLTEEMASETDACRALEATVSRPMRRLVESARQVALTDAPVLITGETGSGKEVLARGIHEWSSRADGPFVELNCAALSDHLIESELFGHVEGSFSGAVSDRAGRFRVADGGTLLLDEVGEMPLEAQTKLLRVLEEGRVLPVGADHTVEVDVRVIAATNVDLDLAIDRGEFREDLYFRLHVFPLHLPPLRHRVEDIPVLVERLLARMQRRTGHGPWRVSEADLRELERYPWPGNVRELVNVLERARVFSPLGGTLHVELGEAGGRKRRRRGRRRWPTMDEHQRLYLEEVLQHTRGKIYGADGAAELLGLPPTTLQSRMKKLGVERPA